MSDNVNSSPSFTNVPPSQVSGWVVLVVDDEADNLVLVHKVLTFNGAEVHIAHDGIEGLNLLKTLSPSLILLDLSMPRLDGWQMCKQVRENPETRGIPIIALTAHAMLGDKERILSAGFDGYIAKPFRLVTFMGEVTRCVQEIARSSK